MSRPTLIKSIATCGTRAFANRESHPPHVVQHKAEICSVVTLDGPPAAPRLEMRKFRANMCSSNSNLATDS